MSRPLIVEIIADSSKFTRGLKDAEQSTGKLGKAAGVAGLAIAGGLAVGLEKSVHAAIEGEQSQRKLDQALKNTHQSLTGTSGALHKAEEASRKMGFTDDETRSSLAKLEVASGSTTKATHLLSVAQDVARFKNVDLESATKMLTMAQTGSQRALKQLGLTVVPVTEAQNKLKESYHAQLDVLRANEKAIKNETAAQHDHFLGLKSVIDQNYLADKATAKLTDTNVTADKITQQVSEHLKGQADVFSGTAAGAMAQFHAQTQHIEEALGKGLLPMITAVMNQVAKFTSFLSEHTTATKVLVGAVGTLGAVLLAAGAATKLQAAATVIWSGVTKAATAAQWLLNTALLANPIVLVIAGLLALGAALVVAWQKSETFRNIVTGTWDAVKTGAQAVLNFFRGNWPVIAVLVSGPFAPIVALATNAFGVRSALIGAFNDVKAAARNIVGDIVGFFAAMPGRIGGAILAGAGAIKSAVTGLFDKVVGWVKDALGIGSPSSVFAEIGKNVVLGFVHGVGSMAGMLKDAVLGMITNVLPQGGPGGASQGPTRGAPGGSAPPGGFAGNLVDVGHALQRMGFQVGEHPAFGGVHPVHAPGSYHYLGRAIDINWPGGGPVELSHLRGIFPGLNATPHVELLIEDIGSGNQHEHFAMAMGGIVTRPTHALIGEAGPEAVIPLSRVGGGGPNVYVTVQGNVTSERDLATTIRNELVRAGKRNGGGMLGGQG